MRCRLGRVCDSGLGFGVDCGKGIGNEGLGPRFGRCHDGLEVRVEGRFRDHSRNLEDGVAGLEEHQR